MAIEHRMLVVDDEAMIVEEMIDVFDGRRFHCRGATSVDEALALIRADPKIALIVTDLKMPGKSGVDLIIEARRIVGRRIIFIVVSGHGNASSHEALQAQEVFRILQKPLSVKTLVESVQEGFQKLATPGVGKGLEPRRNDHAIAQ